MSLEIREFLPDDYDAVLALWQACEGVGLSESDSREGTCRFLERNPKLSRVAVAGSRIVGAVLAGHDGRRGLIHHLAVDPSVRRQGIARRLVESCLDGLRRAGIDKCHVFVFSDNGAAKAFFEVLGATGRLELCVFSLPTGGRRTGDTA
jgi:ribosomal protein S18 acetylase RimI-like enzyme